MSFLFTQIPAGEKFDHVVGSGEQFETIEAALASESVLDGHKIKLKAGTYTLTSLLVISKQVKIFGEGKNETIIEGSFSTATNSSLISVTADNVLLTGIGFKQLAGAVNFCIIGQRSDASRPGDSVKINNFSLINCKVEYPKHGVEIRGTNTVIKNVEFVLIPGSSSTRYPLMFSHSEGEAFISGCHFNHPTALAANNRLIYLRGSGQAGSDSSYSGVLTIENSTCEGFVSQFVNHDNLSGSNFEVVLRNNDTRAVEDVCSGDTNAFFVAVGSNPNIYSKIVCENNKLENKHNVEGLGKGMFYLATTGARTTSLPVFASGNELTNLILRATDVTGANSPDALFTVLASIDYSQLNPFDFTDTLPSGLPVAPADPTAFEDSSLSGVVSEITFGITQDLVSGEESFVLFIDKEDLKEIQKVAESATFSDENNWRLVGVILKHTESAKRVIAAFRNLDEARAAKIRSELEPGDQIKFHKLIISTDERELLVLDPSDL